MGEKFIIMSSAGEILVGLSSLDSGTAEEHLLHITAEEMATDMATDYLEEKLGKLLFFNENFVNVGDQGGLRGSEISGNFYIALFKGDPGELGLLGDEADYIGYTRVPIQRGADHWEYKYNSIRNIDPIVWPVAESENEITHFGILDSLENGNVLYYSELPEKINIVPGNYIEIGYNQLVVKIY